jgi:hypothetical protein
MYPTLLDTKTGKKVDAKEFDSSFFWWADGNGSCDCNRAIAMGDDVDDEMTSQFGEGVCFGCTRIIAVDVHGDLEGLSKAEVLAEMNSEYPDELIKAHLEI